MLKHKKVFTRRVETGQGFPEHFRRDDLMRCIRCLTQKYDSRRSNDRERQSTITPLNHLTPKGPIGPYTTAIFNRSRDFQPQPRFSTAAAIFNCSRDFQPQPRFSTAVAISNRNQLLVYGLQQPQPRFAGHGCG